MRIACGEGSPLFALALTRRGDFQYRSRPLGPIAPTWPPVSAHRSVVFRREQAMKWAAILLSLFVVAGSSGCWRPYYGYNYAQPAYTQPAPIVQQPAPVYAQPAPVYQQQPCCQPNPCCTPY